MLRHYLELPRAVHILCVGTLINRAGTLHRIDQAVIVRDLTATSA